MVTQNPYVGPAPIAAGAPLYGRDDETRDLYHLLLNERIVLLYSPSGAGKTSLIQAGLVPLLSRDAALRLLQIDGLVDGAAGARLGVANRYMACLVAQVERVLPQTQRGRYDWHKPKASLHEYLKQVRDWGGEDDTRQCEVLVLDHFEDLLLEPHDRKDKQAFFHELGQALADRSRHALFSMGEHHVAELDEYLHYVPTALARRFRLGLLGRRQARHAITGPAAELHVRYEPRALAGLMLKLRTSTESHRAGGSSRRVLSEWVEPMQLQLVCQRLWAKTLGPPTEATRSIGAADVKAFSVGSALEEYYDDTVKVAALAAPPTTERDVREWIEDRLILPSGARGQALHADTAGLRLPDGATEVLRERQLVRLQMLGDSRWFELAYDTLVEPIRRSNQRWFANLAPLQRKAREWSRAEHPERLKLSVLEILSHCRWRFAHFNELRPHEHEFWRQSMLRVLWARIVPGLIALAAVFFASKLHEQSLRADIADVKSILAEAEAAQAKANELQAEVKLQEEKDVRRQQQVLVRLGNVKELALQRSLASALIEGARTAGEVEHFADDDARDTLEVSVRDSLMSVLRTASNVRKLIVHDDARMKAVAVQPGSTKQLFAYGGTGGQVWLADTDGLLPGDHAVACSMRTDVKSLTFNLKGSLLAIGCDDGSVSVWSTSDWSRKGEWTAHKRGTKAVAFDRHGTALASGGEGDNSVKLMSLTPDGSPIAAEPIELKAKFKGGIWTLAYSPTDDILVVGDGVGALWRCDLGRNGECVLKQEGGTNDAVIAATFNAEGTCLATGSFKGIVKLWDWVVPSGTEVRPGWGAETNDEPAYSLAFVKRNQAPSLAVGRSTRLQFARVDPAACDVVPGNPRDSRARGSSLVTVGDNDEVTGLAFHATKGLLAVTTGMGYLALLDINGQIDRARLPPPPLRLPMPEGQPAPAGQGWRGAFADEDPTESRFVIGREDEDKLFVVRIGKDGQTGVSETVGSKQAGILRVTASVARRRVATLGTDGTIKFWTLSQHLVSDPDLDPLPLRKVMKQANDAAAEGGQSLPFPELPIDSQTIPRLKSTRILLSPDGDFLACLFDKGVLMVNLADLSASKWEPTETAALEIAFSADGTLFAGGGDRVWIWDVSSGQLHLRTTRPMQPTGLATKVAELALATTRDDKALVIAGGANGQIFVWDAQTGEPVERIRAGSRPIEQMAFLQAEGLFATANGNAQVTLWDTDDWQPVELTTRRDKVQRTRFLSFSPRGDVLVSGTDDLMAWDIDVHSLRSRVCAILAGRKAASVSKRVADACPAETTPP